MYLHIKFIEICFCTDIDSKQIKQKQEQLTHPLEHTHRFYLGVIFLSLPHQLIPWFHTLMQRCKFFLETNKHAEQNTKNDTKLTHKSFFLSVFLQIFACIRNDREFNFFYLTSIRIWMPSFGIFNRDTICSWSRYCNSFLNFINRCILFDVALKFDTIVTEFSGSLLIPHVNNAENLRECMIKYL